MNVTLKFAITGHTQGIGKGLYSILEPSVMGFSKSTGYDISIKQHRNNIAQEAKNCDVFINNAHDGFNQIYMLLAMIEIWGFNPTKKIINIGSRVAEMQLPLQKFDLLKYQSEKIALKYTHLALASHPEIKCQLEYKWFGYVGTEKILKKYPNLTNKDYITVDQACGIILS